MLFVGSSAIGEMSDYQPMMSQCQVKLATMLIMKIISIFTDSFNTITVLDPADRVDEMKQTTREIEESC